MRAGPFGPGHHVIRAGEGVESLGLPPCAVVDHHPHIAAARDLGIPGVAAAVVDDGFRAEPVSVLTIDTNPPPAFTPG